MKTVLVANPCARGGRVGRTWHRYERVVAEVFSDLAVQLTAEPGEMGRLVRGARDRGIERIVVVGGDGTFNEAINGFYEEGSDSFAANGIEMVFLPAGTGGDFARSIGAQGLPVQLGLTESSTEQIDVGKVTLSGKQGGRRIRCFLNIASLGASGLISRQMNQTSKRLSGKAAFLFGTLKGLKSWRDRSVRLTIDDSFDDVIHISSVVLANGRYFGGGMQVAPEALLNDGQLDVIVIKGAGIRRFLWHSRRLYAGTHLPLPLFEMYRGRRIQVTPVESRGQPILVETDGETPGEIPLICDVMPKCLTVRAPWHRSNGILAAE